MGRRIERAATGALLARALCDQGYGATDAELSDSGSSAPDWLVCGALLPWAGAEWNTEEKLGTVQGIRGRLVVPRARTSLGERSVLLEFAGVDACGVQTSAAVRTACGVHVRN